MRRASAPCCRFATPLARAVPSTMSFQGNDDKERIQSATDIVRLIGEHVQLRPKGRELAGLCPFHDDKKPSMFVSPAKQIYKCFSCGAGGDCFTFAMEYHKLDFREALKHLADRAGIELTPYRKGAEGAGPGAESGQMPARKRLLEANAQAQAFFRAALADPQRGQAARDYLAQRGVTDAMVERFGLGYAPDAWDALAQHIAERGLDAPAFGKAGHISIRGNSDPDAVVRDAADCYDKMRHRLIFPICDDMGRPIAFGGRILPGAVETAPKADQGEGPKYLNSPETAVFNKSQTLYGLDLAKKAIIASKQAVIVEGYTDVIACHQHGVENVVAALGTAFTHQHAAKLRRFCETVVLVFDGDAAGYKAADRAVEVFFGSRIDVSVVILPSGLDPADLISGENGVMLWQRMVKDAPDSLTYMFARLDEDVEGSHSPQRRGRVVREFIDRLVQVGLDKLSINERSVVVRRIAAIVGDSMIRVNELITSSLSAEKIRKAKQYQPAPLHTRVPESDGHRSSFVLVSKSELIAQEYIVGCIVREPDLFFPNNIDEELAPEELPGDHRQLYRMICKKLGDGSGLSLRSLLATLAEVGLTELSALLTSIDAKVEMLIGQTTYSVESILRSHVDALRFIRSEKEYIAEKAKYRLERADPNVIDAAASRFLEYAVKFFTDNPSPGRVGGYTIEGRADRRRMPRALNDPQEMHNLADASLESALNRAV